MSEWSCVAAAGGIVRTRNGHKGPGQCRGELEIRQEDNRHEDGGVGTVQFVRTHHHDEADGLFLGEHTLYQRRVHL